MITDPVRDHRVVFVASPSVMSKIERIKTATDAATWSEVIRSALTRYDSLLQLTSDGTKMYTISPSGEQKQVILL